MNLTREGLDYGTKIVGGVTPGRAGRDVYGVPVYDCVRDIVPRTARSTGSIVSVPPRFTRDAVFEAIENGVKLIVIVTESIPRSEVAQMVELAHAARRAHHRPELPRHALARRGEDGRPRRARRRTRARPSRRARSA